jgi:hypothetical protein
MKFSEGIKHKGKPFHIPDCSRNEFPLFCKELGFKIGAEIGVYEGLYTELFCKEDIFMYAIDPWLAYSGAGRTERDQERQDQHYEIALKRLKDYNCKIIRTSSMPAIELFKNNSLDFVYIDGNHEFRYFAGDLVEWYKKVKPGGIVAGHDYWNTIPEAWNVICHVKAIVDAYTTLYDLDFFTFGGTNKKGRKNYSWMFFK